MVLPQELKSWWVPKPVASLNSVFYILICQVQIITRMLFGFLMVLGIAFLLIQRSGTAKQTMPITFILLLLGIACGLAGKLCVDTLGGNGYHWLLYWEVLCFIHFFANIWISALFFILHGPITGSQVSTGKSTFFPYWIRRFLFYATSVLLLPLLCGLMPFAGPGEWKDHFYLLTTDYIWASGGLKKEYYKMTTKFCFFGVVTIIEGRLGFCKLVFACSIYW